MKGERPKPGNLKWSANVEYHGFQDLKRFRWQFEARPRPAPTHARSLQLSCGQNSTSQRC